MKLHDGLRSRTFWQSTAAAIVGVGVATVALFTDRATFVEWAAFMGGYVPMVFGLAWKTKKDEKLATISKDRA